MPSLSKAKLLSKQDDMACGVKEFLYRGIDTSNAGDGADLGKLPANTEVLWGESTVRPSPEMEKKYTEDEMNAREQQAWKKGVQEAADHAREDLEKGLASEREKLAAALNEFAREREEYFRNVEAEVIRLVLAVARKVLHREAQVDPLALTGVARVALEKIANSTNLKLRVPAVQADAWRTAMESLRDSGMAIEVVGESSLKGPECLIVTESGTTDISLEGQLAEIERGFLDLLSQRPGNNSKELRVPSYATCSDSA